jgi:hypothetical protein
MTWVGFEPTTMCAMCIYYFKFPLNSKYFYWQYNQRMFSNNNNNKIAFAL